MAEKNPLLDKSMEKKQLLLSEITDIVNNSISRDVKDFTNWRFLCRKSGNYAEIASHIFSGASMVTSFTAGYFNVWYVSFIAGTLGAVSLSLQIFSRFSFNESKEKNDQLQITLDNLNSTLSEHLIKMPDVVSVDEAKSDEK